MFVTMPSGIPCRSSRGALLDVQFWSLEGFVIALIQFYLVEFPAHFRVFANFTERLAIVVFESPCGVGGKSCREHAAAEASDAEAGRFFGGEDQQFDGMAGTKSGALESTNGFEASENSYYAVVLAGVWDSASM